MRLVSFVKKQLNIRNHFLNEKFNNLSFDNKISKITKDLTKLYLYLVPKINDSKIEKKLKILTKTIIKLLIEDYELILNYESSILSKALSFIVLKFLENHNFIFHINFTTNSICTFNECLEQLTKIIKPELINFN